MKEKLEEEQGVAIDIKSIDLEDPQTLALLPRVKLREYFSLSRRVLLTFLNGLNPLSSKKW